MVKKVGKVLKVTIIVLVLISIFSLDNVSVFAKENTVYLGGFSAGFTLNTKGAEVIGLSDVVTEKGIISPSKDADIKVKDIILNIGGEDICNLTDLEKLLEKSNGSKLLVTLKRGNEIIIKEVLPAKDINGKFKLGLLIRDKLSGIGTVTYIDQDRNFMALGHPVVDENQNLIDISSGDIFLCNIYGIEKGVRGKAGELKGMFYSNEIIGKVEENLLVGLKGKMEKSFDLSKFQQINIGAGHPGTAQIVANIEGTNIEKFDISIVKVDNNNKDYKNFVIKITDKKLIDMAGGIVQGMSGSPIIQDGNLIGAVTHVFLNDPTRGFGISIENMME